MVWVVDELFWMRGGSRGGVDEKGDEVLFGLSRVVTKKYERVVSAASFRFLGFFDSGAVGSRLSLKRSR